MLMLICLDDAVVRSPMIRARWILRFSVDNKTNVSINARSRETIRQNQRPVDDTPRVPAPPSLRLDNRLDSMLSAP